MECSTCGYDNMDAYWDGSRVIFTCPCCEKDEAVRRSRSNHCSTCNITRFPLPFARARLRLALPQDSASAPTRNRGNCKTSRGGFASERRTNRSYLTKPPRLQYPLKSARCRSDITPLKLPRRGDAGTRVNPVARLLRPPPPPPCISPTNPHTRQGVFKTRGRLGGSGLRAWRRALHAAAKTISAARSAPAARAPSIPPKKSLHKFAFFWLKFEKVFYNEVNL